MSGHSHFKTVKATKDANDAKKGKLFSKLARVITISVKEKGGDPLTNANLKTAIEKAKEFNMPKENIERAIKKGTGELVGENLEEVSFEGFGPGGFSIIIDGITDNKNRTLGEIKGILNQYGGKIAGEGAVRWMFTRKGLVIANPEGKPKEEMELLAIEAGAGDLYWRDGFLDIYTKPEDLERVKKILEDLPAMPAHAGQTGKKVKIESSSLGWVANEGVAITEKEKETAQKLFEALDENDAVQDIYSNLNL